MQTTLSDQSLRQMAKDTIEHLPAIGEIASRTETSVKHFIIHNKDHSIFEQLGFKFFGPFDGHNIPLMLNAFENIKHVAGPVVVQIVTRKGNGWYAAESNATKWHGPGAYDYKTSEIKKNAGNPPTYIQIFARTLTMIAEKDSSIVGITAAIADGTGLEMMRQRFPKRYFDVGIAEQHAVIFAGGMAATGIIPVVAIYSTFMQRAIDQIFHDICAQNLHVVFALDRAGIVGEDRHTQHGVFDIAFMCMLPNMKIMVPKNEEELQRMLYTAIYMDGPVAVRYPRGKALGIQLSPEPQMLEIGKAELLSPTSIEEAEHADCTLLAYGAMVTQAAIAAKELAQEGIKVAVVNYSSN
ncbi:1-deoxy-D-xylulose-5-phosphate synthase N-terminal domain-containing protein [Ktedonobacter robiniae]|uniref:1-deoxy-D-xylulose-5-phosphate synthase n=1 Tax=Ktedonobacter robiniae TaxID=2778365 RepID=A0ABQ3UYL3_9CHLR|nr:1-deoxy-D-xylulose-5-phosphate synthase N-terminal domain-containing protein [Ktedonobacter robiniae]GHO57883.1 hypothetical protein KSB_63580 [Ktedonobacter robiniae]